MKCICTNNIDRTSFSWYTVISIHAVSVFRPELVGVGILRCRSAKKLGHIFKKMVDIMISWMAVMVFYSKDSLGYFEVASSEIMEETRVFGEIYWPSASKWTMQFVMHKVVCMNWIWANKRPFVFALHHSVSVVLNYLRIEYKMIFDPICLSEVIVPALPRYFCQNMFLASDWTRTMKLIVLSKDMKCSFLGSQMHDFSIWSCNPTDMANVPHIQILS